MDPKPTEDARIQELIRISRSSRSQLGREFTGLKRKLELPLRIRDSLKSTPTKWLLGSMAAGLVTSLLLRRRPAPKEDRKRGFFSHPLIALTLTAVQPLAKVWLSGKLKELAAHMLTRSQASESNNNPFAHQSNVRTPGP